MSICFSRLQTRVTSPNVRCLLPLLIVLLTFSSVYAAVCGDGIPELPEQCDEGGKNGQIVSPAAILNGAAVGCLVNCMLNVTSLSPTCGNGFFESPEQCDGFIDVCNADCTLTKINLDRRINPNGGKGEGGSGEQCDTGGSSAFCLKNAQISSCGDGITNSLAGEQCDDKRMSPTCTTNCTISSCGDGILNPAAKEKCDLGAQNGQSGSSCLSNCRVALPVQPGTTPIWVLGLVAGGTGLGTFVFLKFLKHLYDTHACKYGPCKRPQSMSTEAAS